MVDKVKLGLIVGQVIGPHSMQCVLSLLKFIFKAYKELIHFPIFLYALVVRVEVGFAH